MNESADHSSNDADGWPLPSYDVLRELDPPAVTWAEAEPVFTPPTHLPARG